MPSDEYFAEVVEKKDWLAQLATRREEYCKMLKGDAAIKEWGIRKLLEVLESFHVVERTEKA